MSDDMDGKPYNSVFATGWTLLSAVVAVGIFLAFCLNGPLTNLFRWIWDLLRYLASPII